MSSSVNGLIEFCCDFDEFCLMLIFLIGVSGISGTFEMKGSTSISLPLGGIQFDLFLTRLL